jgi:hypothetical protein
VGSDRFCGSFGFPFGQVPAILRPVDRGEDAMLRLMGLFYSLIASTLAGVCVVVMLVSGYTTLAQLIGAAAVGAVVAVPVSYLVAKQLKG